MHHSSVLDQPHRIPSVYLEKAIWIGVFLGGPLAAGYMLASNFRATDRAERLPMTWGIAVAVTVVIFYLFISLPALADFPSFIVPLLTGLVAGWVFRTQQLVEIDRLIDRGASPYSRWRAVLIGIICLVVSMVVVVILVLLPELEL